MAELEIQLRKFFATFQINESMKSLGSLKASFDSVMENFGLAGTDGFWDSVISRLTGMNLKSDKLVKQLFDQLMKAAGVSKEAREKLNGQFGLVVVSALPLAILLLIGMVLLIKMKQIVT